MNVKTIKGIDNEKWREFKVLAARKQLALGKLFEIMLEDYSGRADVVWDKILSGEKILSDKEASELKSEVSKLRKEKGFRI